MSGDPKVLTPTEEQTPYRQFTETHTMSGDHLQLTSDRTGSPAKRSGFISLFIALAFPSYTVCVLLSHKDEAYSHRVLLIPDAFPTAEIHSYQVIQDGLCTVYYINYYMILYYIIYANIYCINRDHHYLKNSVGVLQ